MEQDLLTLSSTEHVTVPAPVNGSNGTTSFAYSVYETRNSRRKMEDCFTIEPNLNAAFDLDLPNTYGYYAVFDGHSGVDAAKYAQQNLHVHLVQNENFRRGDIETALREAIQQTDKLFCEQNTQCGCTALCAVTENESKVYVAWLGDSSALITRNGEPITLTKPHSAECAKERQRIEQAGGHCFQSDVWRVMGSLAVSRSIGDATFKPFVSGDADIVSLDLQGNEDFLVLGCDGLWDFLGPFDISSIVYEYLTVNAHRPVSEVVHDIAQILSQKAIDEGSQDNITAIVVFLRDLEKIVPRTTVTNGKSAMSHEETSEVNVENGLVSNGYHHEESASNTYTNGHSFENEHNFDELQAAFVSNNDQEQNFIVDQTSLDDNLQVPIVNDEDDQPHSIIASELPLESQSSNQIEDQSYADPKPNETSQAMDYSDISDLNPNFLDTSSANEAANIEQKQEEQSNELIAEQSQEQQEVVVSSEPLLKLNEAEEAAQSVECEYGLIPNESVAVIVDLADDSEPKANKISFEGQTETQPENLSQASTNSPFEQLSDESNLNVQHVKSSEEDNSFEFVEKHEEQAKENVEIESSAQLDREEKNSIQEDDLIVSETVNEKIDQTVDQIDLAVNEQTVEPALFAVAEHFGKVEGSEAFENGQNQFESIVDDALSAQNDQVAQEEKLNDEDELKHEAESSEELFNVDQRQHQADDVDDEDKENDLFSNKENTQPEIDFNGGTDAFAFDSVQEATPVECQMSDQSKESDEFVTSQEFVKVPDAGIENAFVHIPNQLEQEKSNKFENEAKQEEEHQNEEHLISDDLIQTADHDHFSSEPIETPVVESQQMVESFVHFEQASEKPVDKVPESNETIESNESKVSVDSKEFVHLEVGEEIQEQTEESKVHEQYEHVSELDLQETSADQAQSEQHPEFNLENVEEAIEKVTIPQPVESVPVPIESNVTLEVEQSAVEQPEPLIGEQPTEVENEIKPETTATMNVFDLTVAPYDISNMNVTMFDAAENTMIEKHDEPFANNEINLDSQESKHKEEVQKEESIEAKPVVEEKPVVKEKSDAEKKSSIASLASKTTKVAAAAVGAKMITSKVSSMTAKSKPAVATTAVRTTAVGKVSSRLTATKPATGTTAAKTTTATKTSSVGAKPSTTSAVSKSTVSKKSAVTSKIAGTINRTATSESSSTAATTRPTASSRYSSVTSKISSRPTTTASSTAASKPSTASTRVSLAPKPAPAATRQPRALSTAASRVATSTIAARSSSTAAKKTATATTTSTTAGRSDTVKKLIAAREETRQKRETKDSNLLKAPSAQAARVAAARAAAAAHKLTAAKTSVSSTISRKPAVSTASTTTSRSSTLKTNGVNASSATKTPVARKSIDSKAKDKPLTNGNHLNGKEESVNSTQAPVSPAPNTGSLSASITPSMKSRDNKLTNSLKDEIEAALELNNLPKEASISEEIY